MSTFNLSDIARAVWQSPDGGPWEAKIVVPQEIDDDTMVRFSVSCLADDPSKEDLFPIADREAGISLDGVKSINNKNAVITVEGQFKVGDFGQIEDMPLKLVVLGTEWDLTEVVAHNNLVMYSDREYKSDAGHAIDAARELADQMPVSYAQMVNTILKAGGMDPQMPTMPANTTTGTIQRQMLGLASAVSERGCEEQMDRVKRQIAEIAGEDNVDKLLKLSEQYEEASIVMIGSRAGLVAMDERRPSHTRRSARRVIMSLHRLIDAKRHAERDADTFDYDYVADQSAIRDRNIKHATDFGKKLLSSEDVTEEERAAVEKFEEAKRKSEEVEAALLDAHNELNHTFQDKQKSDDTTREREVSELVKELLDRGDNMDAQQSADDETDDETVSESENTSMKMHEDDDNDNPVVPSNDHSKTAPVRELASV